MFRERKTLEAASFLLGKLGGETEYLKLVKLLYLADRQMLLTRKRTITGDQMNALDYGPILSNTLNRLDGKVDDWKDFVSNPRQYRVKLEKPLDPAALSRAELKALSDTLDEHGSKTWQQLIDYTHKLPEWLEKGIPKNRHWAIIHLKDMGRVLGFSPDEIDAIEQGERERTANDDVAQALGAKSAYV